MPPERRRVCSHGAQSAIAGAKASGEYPSRRAGFLTGQKATYADLALFLQLWELLEDDQFPAALSQLQLPQLRRFMRTLASDSAVVRFLSKKRMPRNKPFDGTSYPFVPGRTTLPPSLAEEDAKEL